MEGNLVIVESPAKAGRIQSFLGKDYIVKSSYGHIRDLQDKKLSVDIEHGFSPEYVVPSDKKKVVTELKKLAEKAGLSLRTVCYLESRGTNPTFETVCALAEAFGCATDELRPGNFCNEEKICGRK